MDFKDGEFVGIRRLVGLLVLIRCGVGGSVLICAAVGSVEGRNVGTGAVVL